MTNYVGCFDKFIFRKCEMLSFLEQAQQKLMRKKLNLDLTFGRKFSSQLDHLQRTGDAVEAR